MISIHRQGARTKRNEIQNGKVKTLAVYQILNPTLLRPNADHLQIIRSRGKTQKDLSGISDFLRKMCFSSTQNLNVKNCYT